MIQRKDLNERILKPLLPMTLMLGVMWSSIIIGYADEIVAYVDETGYETFDGAKTAWNDNTTLKLNKDTEIDAPLSVSGTKTLDLNGFGLIYTGSNNNESGRVISVNSNGNLTIIDSNSGEEHKYTIDTTPLDYAESYNGAGLVTVNDSVTENYSTFTGGYITGGKCSGVFSEGTFNMTAGTIIGNKTGATPRTNGGGVCSYNIFTMSGGCILGNFAQSSGGGIYLGNNSTFNMSGGEISQNYAATAGGGIGMENGVQATMTDGEISSNYTNAPTNGGGGVYLTASNNYTCSFSMTEGMIKDNLSKKDGGGVYIDKNGSFTMAGGSIKDNRCSRIGGGIYSSYNAKVLNISGGSIIDNQAEDKYGGGIYTSGFKASGDPVVKDNRIKSGNNYVDGNLYMGYGSKITVEDEFTTGAEIHLTEKDVNGYYLDVFTSGFSTKNPNTDPSKFFFNDNSESEYSIGLKNGEAAFFIKVTLTEDQKPTAVKDLTYTGSNLNLVNEPTADLPENCTMKYVLGNNSEDIPTSGWDESIPTGKDAKTYYVWYKAVKSDGTESDAGVITVTIDKKAEAHTHDIKYVEAKEPTCTEDGYEAHYECTVEGCGEWFEDETKSVPIDKEKFIKKAIGHKWDKGEITQEATYDETGIKTYTCTKCGETKAETIPRKIRKDNGKSSDDSYSSSDSYSDNDSSSSGSSGKTGSVSSKSIDINGNTIGNIPANHQPESGMPVSDVGGTWGGNENSWTYTKSDGSLAKGEWLNLEYNGLTYWYYFDDSTIMQTNWFSYNGATYYLAPEMDGWRGRMVTGWHAIGDKWYYFEPTAGANQGQLYRGMVTPDGHTVGADGAWDGNGTAPVSYTLTGTTVSGN